MQNASTAIVIGAGIAGMASAIRLAVQGFAVQVFEKNAYAGGKMSYFESNGYCFDGGPSLFTQPYLLEELFALAGEPMEPYLRYQKVPVACTYFYEDGTMIQGFADAQKLAEELHRKVGEDKVAVTDYLHRAKQLYDTTGNIFLNYSLHKKSTLQKAPIANALMQTRPDTLLSTFHSFNKKRFKKAHTVQLFNRYATYNGSNPYKAPGMLSVIPHLEYNEGIIIQTAE